MGNGGSWVYHGRVWHIYAAWNACPTASRGRLLPARGSVRASGTHSQQQNLTATQTVCVATCCWQHQQQQQLPRSLSGAARCCNSSSYCYQVGISPDSH
jgi:hypothetical protein